MPFKDKQKAKEKNAGYHRKWYKNNKIKQKKWVNNRKDRIRKMIIEYKKNHHCIKCGESHPACLDFHHCNDDKRFNIGHSVTRGYGWETILKEISKCVVFCKNCHAKEHWMR